MDNQSIEITVLIITMISGFVALYHIATAILTIHQHLSSNTYEVIDDSAYYGEQVTDASYPPVYCDVCGTHYEQDDPCPWH